MGRQHAIENAVRLQALAIAAEYGLSFGDVMLLAGFEAGDFCVYYNAEARARIGARMDGAGAREGSLMADVTAMVGGVMALELR
jgi:hypothetical protein